MCATIIMQVYSSVDMEGIVTSLTSGLQNCAVAVYNVGGYSSASKIKALCIACGAMCSRIFMVTSVRHSESKCKLYHRYTEVWSFLYTWHHDGQFRLSHNIESKWNLYLFFASYFVFLCAL